MPSVRTRMYMSRMLDLSGGLRSGISDYGARPNRLVVAENVEFRPYRACRVRKGSQRLSSGTLGFVPHSLLEWVSSSGTSNKYVASTDNPNGKLYRYTNTTFTLQTTPAALGQSTWLVWDQLNGAIFATENGGSLAPFFYRSTNTAETWLTSTLPTPGATLTLTPGVGGAMTAGAGSFYAYRLRWLHSDGSSPASTPQATAAMGVNTSVNVTTIPLGARTDYLSWILERSVSSPTAGAATAGPFYFVASGTANNYNDLSADGDLGYKSNGNWFTGVPGAHFDGLIAMQDRLAGWVSSTLYVSMPIADISGAGILNFNALNAYDFGRDDGENIRAVVKQGDRLLVLKDTSGWALEGNDPSNFRVVPLWKGAGASGPRAAASMGTVVVFYGAAGLHRVVGNEARPFGYVEVGDVLEKFYPAKRAEVVIRNHLGQRILIQFSYGGSVNDRTLVYDTRFNTWSVWTAWIAQDILVPKIIDFGDAETFIFADPTDYDPTGAVDCRLWLGFYGFGDFRHTDGSAATGVPVRLVTPWIDDGLPDYKKRLDWVQPFAYGDNVSMTALFETDPASESRTVVLAIPAGGKLWNSGWKWGDGTIWGTRATEATVESGIRIGMIGKRFRATYRANPTGDFGFKGHAVQVTLQPERRLS